MHIVDIKGRSRYHRGSKEAVQMMLAWPGSPYNIPEKQGQTPLWHALGSVGKRYDVYFFFGPGFPDNDHFDGFVKYGCSRAHHGVDPLQPTAFAKAPLGFGCWTGLDSQQGQDARLWYAVTGILTHILLAMRAAKLR